MSDDVKTTFKGDDQITPVIDKINRSLDNFDKEAQKADKSGNAVSVAFKNIAVAAGGYITVKKLADVLKFSVSEAMEAQKVDAILAQTIRATGNAAGLTAEQVSKMASELQKVTTYGDEAIKTGQSLLLTFKNIGGDVFPRTTRAMLDMSASMGQDLSSTAMQLGKALNDPVEGLSALARVGVKFTDEQEIIIKKFMKMGEVSKAQGVILDELESQFGGVAMAMANTDFGRWEQAKNTFGDMAETVGLKLLPLLTDVVNMLSEVADGWLYLFGLNDNKDKLKQLELQKQGVDDLTEAVKRQQAVVDQAIFDEEVLGFSDEAYANTQKQIKYLTELKKDLASANSNLLSTAGIVEKSSGSTASSSTTTTSTKNTVVNIDTSQALSELRELMTEGAKLEWERIENLDNSIEKDIQMRLDAYAEIEQIEKQITELQAEEQAIRDQNDQVAQQKRLETIKNSAISVVDMVSQSVTQITDAVYNKQLSDVDREESLKKKSVSNSKKSEAQKAKDIEKIEEDARKKRYEIAIKDWRMSIVMSTINTLLSVTKTLSSVAFPASVPLSIAAGAAGAVTTGLIAANKPEFATGGFYNGVSYSGDKTNAYVNSGEAVLNPMQQKRFMDFANGKSYGGSKNISIGDTVINIGGNATSDTVIAIKEENTRNRQLILDAIYEAKEKGEIDNTRVNI